MASRILRRSATRGSRSSAETTEPCQFADQSRIGDHDEQCGQPGSATRRHSVRVHVTFIATALRPLPSSSWPRSGLGFTDVSRSQEFGRGLRNTARLHALPDGVLQLGLGPDLQNVPGRRLSGGRAGSRGAAAATGATHSARRSLRASSCRRTRAAADRRSGSTRTSRSWGAGSTALLTRRCAGAEVQVGRRTWTSFSSNSDAALRVLLGRDLTARVAVVHRDRPEQLSERAGDGELGSCRHRIGAPAVAQPEPIE